MICRHKENQYSLTIDISNAMVDLSSRGYTAELSIFNMTKESMYELANQIIEAANNAESKPICK